MKIFHGGDLIYFIYQNKILRGIVLSEFGVRNNNISIIFDRNGDGNYKITEVAYEDVFENEEDALESLGRQDIDR